MTNLDEAIKHCEEVAEKNETKGKMIQNNFSKLRREQKQEIDSCLECAKEHRQLAEWLRELKAYEEAREEIIRKRDSGQETLEREDVLNKVVAEIQELDNKVCRQFLIEDVDKEVHRAYQDCLRIINKYRKVKKND